MQSWVLLCLCLWGGWDWCASGVTAQSTTTRAPSTTTTALSNTTTAKSTATLSTTTTAKSTATPNTTTTALSTTTPNTTTTAKSTTTPNTTTTALSTTTPNTTTTAKSTAAPNTTTTAKSTTTPNTTTTAKSTAAPNTTTTAKSTAATALSTTAPNTTTTALSTAALSTTTEMTTTPAPNCTTQWTVTTTTIVGVTQGGFTNATATGNGKNWTEPIQNRTFTFTDLSPGCTYNITLHQGASDHCFSNSTTVASMVSNLTLDSAVTDSLSVSWTGAPGCVTGYTVSVNQTSRVSQLLPNETQLSIGDLTPGTVYEVRVVTMGQGERSAPAPLLASTALDCDAQNWTVGESSLQVEVLQGSFQRASAVRGNSSALNASSTGSTATFSGLEPGCTYTVALWSRLDTRLCEMNWSLSAEPVSNVTVRSLSTTALAASWPGARGCVQQYSVSVSGPDLQSFTKSTTGTALDIPDLQPGCNYTVGVTTEGEGRDSTEVTSTAATDPDSVGSLSCQPLSGGYSLRLSWTAPRGVWTGLEVRVSGRPQLQEVGHQDWVDITGLQPARDYDIAVTTLSGTRRSTAVSWRCQTDPTGVIAGSVIGILLLVILVVFLVLFVMRRQPDPMRWKTFGLSRLTGRNMQNVPLGTFADHVQRMSRDEDKDFSTEYESLSDVGTEQTCKAASTPDNKAKNRFTNVLPYDRSRVKLSLINNDPHSDYINANYMPGYSSKREYIAAQGPLPNTVVDFWRMIWEQRVEAVVMLTSCMEGGKVKCEQYWPLDYTPCTYGDVSVTVSSETKDSDWTLRDFTVKHVSAETRTVKHFHFVAWPDHGTPLSTEPVTRFRGLIRQHIERSCTGVPTLVHCSAGVGRTGTLIALDVLLQQMEEEKTLGVKAFVHKMRLHRPLMVQTEVQYIFLHQCLLNVLRSRAAPGREEILYENTLYMNAAALQELGSPGQDAC